MSTKRTLTARQFIDILKGNATEERFKPQENYGYKDAIVINDIIVEEVIFIYSGDIFPHPIIIKGGEFQQDFRIQGGEFQQDFRIQGGEFQQDFFIRGGEFQQGFSIHSGEFQQVFLIQGGEFQQEFRIIGGKIHSLKIGKYDRHVPIFNHLRMQNYHIDFLLLNQARINSLSLGNSLKASGVFQISNIEVNALNFKQFSNFGNVALNNIQAKKYILDFAQKADNKTIDTTDETENKDNTIPTKKQASSLLFTESNLGRTEFKNVDFNSFDSIIVENSNFTQITTYGKHFPIDKERVTTQAEQVDKNTALFETYRDLAIAKEKQKDIDLALKYKASSHDYHAKMLRGAIWQQLKNGCFWKIPLFDYLILLFGKANSNHNQSWFLPLCWFAVVSMLGFIGLSH